MNRDWLDQYKGVEYLKNKKERDWKFIIGMIVLLAIFAVMGGAFWNMVGKQAQMVREEEQKEDHNNVDDTGIDYQADTIYVRFKDTAPAETVGQLADTILVLDSVKDAIVISNNLIKKVDGTKVVYVLKNGEKTAVEVETGLSTGSQTEIKSGLKEGDEIVIR